jgi:hypothetical protein
VGLRLWTMAGMTPDDVRALALALTGTVELPHHERTSFRVDGRIFATMPPDGESVNVLLDEEGARSAASDQGVELLWWGRKLSGVRVPLAEADRTIVAELLDEAWQRRRRSS